MSFQPVIPTTGLAGFAFLQRTMDSQQESFAQSPVLQREMQHFRENIGAVRSVDDLVGDRRMLAVALGAFGLDDDINSTFFIRKVLQDGTLDPDALGNRLSDKRYLELSRAFGFGDFDTPRSADSAFADRITAAFQERRFEAAVGAQDETMRLALTLQRELPELASRDLRERTLWFEVLGKPDLREAVQTALGLPRSFAALDLDVQVDRLQRRVRGAFGDGSIKQFADPDQVDALTQRFVARAQLDSGPSMTTPGMAALQLLQSGPHGPALGTFGPLR